MKAPNVVPISAVIDAPSGSPTDIDRYAAEPWAEIMRRRSTEGREHLASKLFDQKIILDQINQAAADGFNFVRIDQPLPVTLRETKAAVDLVQTLKTQQFVISWQPASFGLDRRDNNLGEAITYEQLRISW